MFLVNMFQLVYILLHLLTMKSNISVRRKKIYL